MTMLAADAVSTSRRFPKTLWVGLGIILLCEGLLFADVYRSGRGAVHSTAARLAVANPTTFLARVARDVANNMTPFAWAGYLIFIEGVLTYLTGASPIRRRPHHFALL